jgi:hypothetical protein
MMQQPRRVPTVRYRQAEGAYYLAYRWRCFEVGPVGWRIWQLCDGSTPVSDIVSTLVAEYEGAEESDVRADCEAFLKSLVEERLLTWE